MSDSPTLRLQGARTRAVAVVTLVVTALTAGSISIAPPAYAAAADKIAPAIAAAGAGAAITGDALLETSSVTFLGADGPQDDVAASSFVVVDPKKVVAQIPPGAVSGPIAVTSPAGTVVTPVPATIAQVPAIDGVSAPSLPPGATLTIAGSNLLGVKKTTVLFDAKKGTPLPTSTASALQVVVPSGLRGGPLNLQVITEGGVANEDFAVAPAIKAVVPPTGTTVGGTTVTILGSGFTGVDNFSDDPSTPGENERFDGVTFGGVRAANVIAVSDTEVVAVTPPGTDPTARVVVRTAGSSGVATSITPTNFGYQPLPVVRSLGEDWNPVNPPGGAVPVVATGQNLSATTKVMVGTLPATDVVADPEAGTLTFTPPVATKAALSKATFVNTVGAASYSTVVPFSYTTAPTATKLTPATGPAGTVVLVAGTGFVSGTTARFGDTEAACTIVSPVVLRCIAPAGHGPAPVVVTNGVGESAPVPAATFTTTAGVAAPVATSPLPQATVSGLTPAYGATGSTIALKGTNLNHVTRIDFTGTETAWVHAPRFLAVSPTRLVVTVPARAATGVLRLTTPGGRTTSGIVSYRTSVRPAISSIDVVGDATYGVAAGDMVQIKGAGLVVGTIRPIVTIGGKTAVVLARPVPTAKTVLVRVPASVGGREQLTVTTPLGTATAEASLYFTPQIKAVKPRTYVRDGGVPVTISGTGFTGVGAVADAAGGRLSAVTFGGIAVTRLVVMSDKEVVATTAPGSATVDALLVRSQHGSWIGSSDEQVRATNLPVPTVTSVSPATSVLGTTPTPVTITGTNFRAGSSVEFGTAAAVVQSVADDGTSMVVVPPVRTTAARVDVNVTNVVLGEELVGTLAGGFRYVPQPAVTSLSPTSGFTGVTPPRVTINGANLRANSVVRFGDAVATVESVSEDGSRMVVTPPLRNAAGAVDLTVTNLVEEDELSATIAGAYAYELRAFPTVSAVTPDNTVARAPTSAVTVTGTNLRADSVVRFGSAVAVVESASPDGTSLVVVPPVAGAGTVSITITNTIAGDDLAVTQSGAFRYLPTPTITSLSRSSGTVDAAQAPVTITGTNLLPNSVVRFGGAAGALQSVASDGTSLVVTPPVVSTPGPVDVTVTNIVDGEQLTATRGSGYTYLSSQSPTISDVAPDSGTTTVANDAVTVTGTKLRPDTIVRFGSAEATVESVAGDGTSMVVTPPVSATDGFVAVSVTNIVDGQHLTSALAGAYRYLPTPTIATVSPASGLTGSTPPTVTITGTNLRLNSVVRFGTTSATIESAAPNGTSIVVTPPVSNSVATVDVTVTNIVDGAQQLTATRTNGYQYILAAARITGISAGTALPGTQVTLTGTSFSSVSAVRFGSAPATFTVASPTTIYAVVPMTPAEAQGNTVDVTVINGTGQVSTSDPVTADDWTWSSHPFITGMTPATGVQGSQVTISGTGFTGTTAVRFGGIDGIYTVVNDTTLHVTVPVTPSAGSVADVVVVARGLASPEPLVATTNDWIWHPIAVITKLNPNPGAAGSTITVTGRNFTNVRSVNLNGVDVTGSVVVQSSTSLTFTAPPRPGGGGANRTDKPLTIVNGSGAASTAETDPATGKPANLFTWL